VAPTLVREARRVADPIQRMKRSQAALDEMAEKARVEAAREGRALAEQLDRFFAVRKRVDAARRKTDLNLDQLPRKHVRTLEELKQVPGVIQGVSDLVGAEMTRSWRPGCRCGVPLDREAGLRAVARATASGRDLSHRARGGGTGDRRGRPRERRTSASAPASRPWPRTCAALAGSARGFDPEIHALLLSRIDDVERWSLDDLASPFVTVPR